MKRLIGTDRLKWEYNTKMNVKNVWCMVTDRIHLAQGRNQWRVVLNSTWN